MKPWQLFVVGGFAGVIGYLLLLLIPVQPIIDIATVVYDLIQEGIFWVVVVVVVYLCVWIVSGFSSRLALRWENQRSRLIATIFIGLVVGPISGVVITILTLFVMIFISISNQ